MLNLRINVIQLICCLSKVFNQFSKSESLHPVIELLQISWKLLSNNTNEFNWKLLCLFFLIFIHIFCSIRANKISPHLKDNRHQRNIYMFLFDWTIIPVWKRRNEKIYLPVGNTFAPIARAYGLVGVPARLPKQLQEDFVLRFFIIGFKANATPALISL